MYTDKEYLENKFNSLEDKIDTMLAEITSNAKEISVLKRWKAEITVKLGILAAIFTIGITVLKDWALHRLKVN